MTSLPWFGKLQEYSTPLGQFCLLGRYKASKCNFKYSKSMLWLCFSLSFYFRLRQYMCVMCEIGGFMLDLILLHRRQLDVQCWATIIIPNQWNHPFWRVFIYSEAYHIFHGCLFSFCRINVILQRVCMSDTVSVHETNSYIRIMLSSSPPEKFLLMS